jgi:hypothetical protein
MWVRKPADNDSPMATPAVRPHVIEWTGGWGPRACRIIGVLSLTASLVGCVAPRRFCQVDCEQPVVAGKYIQLTGTRHHSGRRLLHRPDQSWACRTAEFGFSRTYWQRFPIDCPPEMVEWSEELPEQPAGERLPSSQPESELDGMEPEAEPPPDAPDLKDAPDLEDSLEADEPENFLDLFPSPSDQGSVELDQDDFVVESPEPAGPASASVSDELDEPLEVATPIARTVGFSSERRAAVTRKEPSAPAVSERRSVRVSTGAATGGVVRRAIPSGVDSVSGRGATAAESTVSTRGTTPGESSTAVPVSFRSRFRQPTAQASGLFGGWLR